MLLSRCCCLRVDWAVPVPTGLSRCYYLGVDCAISVLTGLSLWPCLAADASERHRAGVDLMLRQLLLVMMECVCQSHEVVSRLGCACIRYRPPIICTYIQCYTITGTSRNLPVQFNAVYTRFLDSVDIKTYRKSTQRATWAHAWLCYPPILFLLFFLFILLHGHKVFTQKSAA